MGVGLFASLRVSTVRGLEFTINSTLVIKVLRDSLFKDKPWVCGSPWNMFLAVRIWRSQTATICDAGGGLWFQSIQSAPFSCKTFLILSWFIPLNPCCNSLLVPTKFVPLSDQIDLTAALIAINLLSARMKELASKAFVISMCRARQEKHVNNAPYLFNCDLLWWGKGRTDIHHSRWMEEFLCIRLVDQPFFENPFFSKLATCNTSINYTSYSCVCTDYPNIFVPQVIQSQSSCAMCNTIMAPLDHYVRHCFFLEE